MRLKRLLSVAACLLLAVVVTACGTSAPMEDPATIQRGDYQLGPNDSVRIMVFGEEDLSGIFPVDGSGTLALPLIGQVEAQGKTLRELETAVAARLADGFIRNPQVNAAIAEYRPFSVIGEVQTPGRYSYEAGMTALDAVAKAGGFTYRGRQDYVMVTRGNDPSRTERRAMPTTPVFPDDVIRVPERYF